MTGSAWEAGDGAAEDMPGQRALDAPGAPAPGAPALFAGDGEMRARCRALDWAATPLGPVDAWGTSLRTAVELCLASPFPMCLWWGPELTLVHNDWYSAVIGDARHAWALGRSARAVWAEVWDQIEPEFAEVMAGGAAVWHEDQRFVLTRDGREEERYFTYAFSPVRDEGGAAGAWVGGVLNVFTETTERVRLLGAERAARAAAEDARARAEAAEQQLQTAFAQAPALVAVTEGPEHRFVLANSGFEAIVGRGDLVGRTVREALPELEAQGIFALFDRVYATGEPFVAEEQRVLLPRDAGSYEGWYRLVYQPLLDAAGRVTGILQHAVEVTEQVRARREVERLLDESELARADAEEARRGAEAAGRLKSEFLSTMSHEFRTPLNAILGYAQLLDMGILGATTPAQHDHLARLETSARHLLRLVDDVLDVAKVDADRLEVRRDPLATGAVVAAALALVQPQATAKGIRVEDHGVPGSGVPYMGDEHRVRQILVNLLSNAVKFTPAGGQITVACGTAAEPDPGVQPGGAGSAASDEDAEGAWAFIWVQDTGPGIAPTLENRLFEPFVQGDGALTRTQGGTGLGLAISRRLARLMGGDLTVQSRPGNETSATGATFTLWLPAPRESVRHAPGDSGAVAPYAGAALGRRTPAGLAAVIAAGDATGAALTAEAYAVVHALGVRLSADTEGVAERFVAALRADGRFPGARDLPGTQLRNHTTPVIGLLAAQLMTIGETRGRAPALLADTAQAQRLMAELHGAQRHRLGWAEAALARETPLLEAEVERALAGAVRGAGDAHLVDVAERYAADVTRHVLDQAMQTALRSYRFARAAAAP